MTMTKTDPAKPTIKTVKAREEGTVVEKGIVRVMVKEGMGDVPESGQWRNYRDWDAAMELHDVDSEYTCSEGEHFPPAQHGSVWVLVDATKHKTTEHRLSEDVEKGL